MNKGEINSVIEKNSNSRFTVDFFNETLRPVYIGYFVILDDFERLKEFNLWRFLHNTRFSSYTKYMEDCQLNIDLAYKTSDLEKGKEYLSLSNEFYQKAKDLTIKIEGKQIESLQAANLTSKNLIQ